VGVATVVVAVGGCWESLVGAVVVDDDDACITKTTQ